MPATPNIPEKPFFRVNEVCRLTDTQPYVLRFWESEFPQLTPERDRGASPVYKKNDVELIFRIKQLLYEEEYTIAGARQVLSGKAGSSKAKAAKPVTRATPVAPREKDPTPRVPRQLELDASTPVSAQPPGIAKERYDDAVEEITHLRLLLADLENRLRRSDHDRDKALGDVERLRDKTDRAIGRLEAVLERFRKPGS